MDHDEIFWCDGCGRNGPIRLLGHRETMSGDYCLICAGVEKCGCCGELAPREFLSWKADVRNYICINCVPDYKEVIPYIKPLVRAETKIVTLNEVHREIKMAS